MAKSTNHQCPNCTGPLRFDAATNKLVCDYCDSTFTVEEIDALYKEKIDSSVEKGMNAEPDAAAQNEAQGTSAFKTYTCSSCGAQLFCDEVTVATSCPYCGNPNVIAGKFNGGEMPDCVIPFKMDKKTAIANLSGYYKGKKLLPKVFSAQNHIEEIKGVYVPFWLFNGSADIKMTCTGQKIDVFNTRNERVERISHYDIDRGGNVPFTNVPVDASKKMDNDMMDSLEPFNYEELKDFTPSYLPGFLAESHDDSIEDCQKRLEERVKASAQNEMLSDINDFSSVQIKESKVKLNVPQKPKYAFLPVWLLSTKWKENNYLFAMNGQTGKMVGKLPVDKGRFCGYLFTITLIGTAILTPILYFLMMRG